ncbi:MAG: CDP-alcohol phosphatidyltransferase family protein [Patescibacteria group bacterium]
MLPNLTITDKILAKTLLRIIPQWLTPNIISWLRLLSVPAVGYFLWTENYPVALPLFFISAFSDAVDGSLARTRDLISNFGKMFDPLADKLLIATAAIVIIPRYLGWEIVTAIISIDIILIASAYLQNRFYGKTIQAENTGKLKMLMQSLGIGALLIYTIWQISEFLIIAQYFFYAAIFFALISLVVYRAV